MTINELKKEKIAILGLSKEGISSGEFLFRHKIPFSILEQQSQKELGKNFDYITKWKMPYFLGKDHLKHLFEFTFILRAPGVPLFLPEIVKAKQKGIKISSSVKLFMELVPTKNIIGVTGTKGKGTTCKLIESVLKADKKEVFVGGNIGVPPLDFLEKVKVKSYVVLELSSFQLEDFEKSPYIAVILGIAPDHLAPESAKAPNYHKSMKDYLEAKKQLVKSQNKNDFIVTKENDQLSKTIGEVSKGQQYFYSIMGEVARGAFVSGTKLKVKNEKVTEIGDINEVKLRGRHHLENICAALSVCSLLDCATKSLRKGLFEFMGYEHRLEFVNQVSDVSYYDDSAATNPEPVIAAIDAFDEPLIVILGGSDKGQDYTKLGEKILNSTVKVAYLIGDMADKIEASILSAQKKEKLNRSFRIIRAGYPEMSKIIPDCISFSEKGDVILLSPACASFDMYENYRQRGDLFKKGIN